ncbi:RNA polymerase sigma factor [Flavitalea flava]
MEHPDNDLIVQFTRGSTQAFTTIYNEYYLSLYRFAKRFIIDQGTAEDITADIFARLWKKRTDFGSIKNIKAFLYVSIRNACLDFLRSQQRQNLKQAELIYLLQQETETGFLQDDIAAEVLKEIYKEIENLPKSCKKVFLLSYIEERSNTEIAGILGISNQSVRNYKQRAIKILRISLLSKNALVTTLLCFNLLTLSHYNQG